MAEHSKRYTRSRQRRLIAAKRYTVEEAVSIAEDAARGRSSTRPWKSAMRLGVDPKQADQIVRGSASLPKGIGKEVRVIAFCAGAAAEAAKAAGAIEAGGEELVNKVTGGWTDFDIAVAVAGHDAPRR